MMQVESSNFVKVNYVSLEEEQTLQAEAIEYFKIHINVPALSLRYYICVWKIHAFLYIHKNMNVHMI